MSICTVIRRFLLILILAQSSLVLAQVRTKQYSYCLSTMKYGHPSAFYTDLADFESQEALDEKGREYDDLLAEVYAKGDNRALATECFHGPRKDVVNDRESRLKDLRGAYWLPLDALRERARDRGLKAQAQGPAQSIHTKGAAQAAAQRPSPSVGGVRVGAPAQCILGENDTNNSGCASYYVICWGDNFEAPDGTGRIFNPVTNDTSDFFNRLSKEEDKATLLKYIISKWAYNKPADTWSCRGFEGRAAYNRGVDYFRESGYKVSPYHSVPTVPLSVLPVVSSKQ